MVNRNVKTREYISVLNRLKLGPNDAVVVPLTHSIQQIQFSWYKKCILFVFFPHLLIHSLSTALCRSSAGLRWLGWIRLAACSYEAHDLLTNLWAWKPSTCVCIPLGLVRCRSQGLLLGNINLVGGRGAKHFLENLLVAIFISLKFGHHALKRIKSYGLNINSQWKLGNALNRPRMKIFTWNLVRFL